MTALQTAQSARDAAQSALDSALASGDDVTDARQRLADAEAAIVGLQEAQREAAAAEAAEVEAAADIMVEAVRSECAALVAEVFEKIKPTLPVDPDRSNALVWAQAKRTHDAARDVLADAQGRVDALAARLADLQAERESIVGRRSRGDVRPDDKADVLLIACDMEGVEQALSRATPERDRLSATARETREALSQCERRIEAGKEAAIQASLKAAQEPLEAALLAVATAFNANRRINAQNWWIINPQLRDCVTAPGPDPADSKVF